MKKLILTIAAVLALTFPAFSKDGVKEQSPTASGNKVDGLELPADLKVNFDEGFVNLQAKCKGAVKWLIVSGLKVKYIPIATDNSIIISIPPQSGNITVFAVAMVDNKLTEFARTNITISQDPTNNPLPSPQPPNNPSGPLHFTFLVDLNNTTPELAQTLNSQNVRNAITSKGSYFRLYDINSPIVAQKKLTAAVQRVGGSSVLVVQRNDGYVLGSFAIPKSEADVIQLINSAIGGK